MTKPRPETVRVPVMGTLNEDGTIDMHDEPVEWVEVERVALDDALDNREAQDEFADHVAPRSRH